MVQTAGPLAAFSTAMNDDKKAELKDAFTEVDKASAGKLGLDDLSQCLMMLGLAPSASCIKELLGGASDADFDAFVALYEKCQAESGGDVDSDELFASFDADGSGAIKATDLLHILKSLGDPMPEDEAKAAIAKADKDNDGYITKEEFKTLMDGL